MVKISACAIVKNEAKNIQHYLKCMQSVADEIIIVDTGSTDNTYNIAKAAGAILYTFKWRNNFSAAKNFALDKVTGEWILFLDADEYFSDKSLRLIRKNIIAIKKEVKIFMCKLINLTESGETKNSVYVVRGLRNDPQLRFHGKIHEQLFYNGQEITNIAIMPDIKIYHTGYLESNIKNKLRRNLKIMNEDISINGNNPRYYSALADCYYGLGAYKEAIFFALKFINSGLKILGSEERIYYTLISSMYLIGKTQQEILSILDKYGKRNLYNNMTKLKPYKEQPLKKYNIFISACVIVKNEEKNIQRYLKYIKPIVDEIIVVDTGSEDNTCKFAEKERATLYKFKWCNDFAMAKNFALDKAKGKWIIFLDADEYFPNNDGQQILKYIKQYDSNFHIDALACKMINIDPDRNNEFLSSFYQLRVFRNDPNMRYIGKIHESLQGKNGKIIQLTVLHDDVHIIHTGYSTSNSQKKSKRNLALLKNEITQNGEDPKYYAYIADSYYGLGDYEKAIYYSKKFINSGLNMIGAEITPYVRYIDSLFLAKHSNNEILTAINFAIEKFKTIPDFYVMKSFMLLKERNYISAEKSLQKSFSLLQVKDFKMTSSVMPRFQNFIYNVAGMLATLRDDIPKAIFYFLKSLQNDKFNIEFWDNFYYTMKNKDTKSFLKALNKIYDINNENHLKFLLAMLIRHELDPKFIYYFNKLNKEEIQNPFIEYVLIAKQKYFSANELLAVRLRELYKKMIFDALTSKDQNKYRKLYLILPNSYKIILENASKKFKRI